jgi:DNA polymerase
VAPATDDAIAALDALREEVECCSGCVLAGTRTRAVFGEGDPGADLMFVGEAPGYHEDQQGRPFVGQAGKLLEQLLGSVGMTREQVYIANVLKSRPPDNRDPRPEEIDACRPYLWRQIEIIRPKVICTLGNFATKLLSGDQRGITKVHGQPRATEIAGHRLYLYPIFHPAAALYTPANLATLKEDFLRLPGLLAHAAPQPGEEAAVPAAAERPAWRPPEHLQSRAAASVDTSSAPALTFDAAPPAPEAPAPPGLAPVAAHAEPPAPAEPPAGSPAPAPAAAPELAAAAAPAEPAAPAPPPVETPTDAVSGGDDPAPVSPPAPEAGSSAEPEQLGLF